MAIRDTMRSTSAPFLQEGETVQAIFGGQTMSPVLLFLLFPLFQKPYRVVVVTDRRILVCRSGSLLPAGVKAMLRELPRETRIGPATGIWWRCGTLGERLYIHKRFHQDVAAADALLTGK
jgi:hypothetical protein